jgi:ectoine hydroxylase-related dioxygenase (phytanoyl-CoA dioxygenase family)
MCSLTKSHAKDLFLKGFCIVNLKNPPDVSIYKICRDEILSNILQLRTRAYEGHISENDLDCHEICQRNNLRYDVPYHNKSIYFEAIRKAVHDCVHATINECERLRGVNDKCVFDYAGSVTSFPKAKRQLWHVDGDDEGVYTVFAPLLDITVEHGGTQFKSKSHIAPKIRHEHITCIPQMTEVLIFDYRILHRGMANRSKHPRPIMYLVFTRLGMRDTLNIPTTTLEERIKGQKPIFSS